MGGRAQAPASPARQLGDVQQSTCPLESSCVEGLGGGLRITVKTYKFKQMSTSKWLLPRCLSKENFLVHFPHIWISQYYESG